MPAERICEDCGELLVDCICECSLCGELLDECKCGDLDTDDEDED